MQKVGGSNPVLAGTYIGHGGHAYIPDLSVRSNTKGLSKIRTVVRLAPSVSSAYPLSENDGSGLSGAL